MDQDVADVFVAGDKGLMIVSVWVEVEGEGEGGGEGQGWGEVTSEGFCTVFGR